MSVQATFDPPANRVLVIMPTWVGDVVMATPLLRTLRAHFARSHITLLLKRHLLDLVAGADWMDECVTWPTRAGGARGRAERRRWLKDQREAGYDLAVLLPNSFRAAWTAWRIGAKRRVGFNRDGRGWLLTDRVATPNRRGLRYEPMPLVDYYAQLAEAIGCERPDDRLTLFRTAEDDQAVARRLASSGFDAGAPLVVICPGAKFGASKCWYPDRFAAVADRLVRERGCRVVISPGPGEEPLARAIAEAMRQPHLVVDEPCLSLGQLKSLIADAALLLGNDTGPRHFARAFDVPRVTVFGPTEPRWTETSHGGERIVRVDVECGPCHKKICPLGHLKCMTLVSVDMVSEACDRMLDEAGESPEIALTVIASP